MKKLLLGALLLLSIFIFNGCSTDNINNSQQATHYLEYNINNNTYTIKLLTGEDITPDERQQYYIWIEDRVEFLENPIYNELQMFHNNNSADIEKYNIITTEAINIHGVVNRKLAFTNIPNNGLSMISLSDITNNSIIYVKFYITKRKQ